MDLSNYGHWRESFTKRDPTRVEGLTLRQTVAHRRPRGVAPSPFPTGWGSGGCAGECAIAYRMRKLLRAREGVAALQRLYFSADLRLPRLRLSKPVNKRFVSVAPTRRRTLLRRSAFLRNLHEQFIGIVQASKGRRGASRSR
jgi:hypothetical protein